MKTRIIQSRVCQLSLVLSLFFVTSSSFAQSNHDVTAAMVETWMTELSNWGRWGENDELATLNLITPEKRKQAAALVTAGVSVSLSHNYSRNYSGNGAGTDGDGEVLPFEHEISELNAGTGSYVMDRISFSYHGALFSHMDSLCHMSYKGKMYNGFSTDEVDDQGCNKLAITDVKQGIMTRGLLMDIAKLKDVDYLAPGTAIYVEDLEAWEEKVGIRVQAGDVIFVRTGRWITPEDAGQGSAGLHASVAPWLKARDVAMVGGDYFNDVVPSGVDGVYLPIHQLLLVAMGVRLFDNIDLEALSAEAEKQQRWEFLLTAAPIAVVGGTGSPLNPIATF